MDQLAIWHREALQPEKLACEPALSAKQHHPHHAHLRDAHLMPERDAQNGTRHREGGSQIAIRTQAFGFRQATLPTLSRERHAKADGVASGGIRGRNQNLVWPIYAINLVDGPTRRTPVTDRRGLGFACEHRVNVGIYPEAVIGPTSILGVLLLCLQRALVLRPAPSRPSITKSPFSSSRDRRPQRWRFPADLLMSRPSFSPDDYEVVSGARLFVAGIICQGSGTRRPAIIVRCRRLHINLLRERQKQRNGVPIEPAGIQAVAKSPGSDGCAVLVGRSS